MSASAPLSILFVSLSRNDPFGGASRVFHLLCDGLKRLGHDVTLVHREDLLDRGTRKISERLWLPHVASRSTRKLRPETFDVVFTSSGMLYPLYESMGRGRTKRVHYLPGVAFFDHQATLQEAARGHLRLSSSYRHVTGPLPSAWDMKGARSSDGIIVNCMRDWDYFVDQGISEEVVRCIPLPVHPEVLDARLPRDAAPPRRRHSAIWFGSWSDRKGIAYLPRAWAQVLARFPDATLTIGGTGKPRSEIEALFSGMDTSNIHVLGRVSIQEQVQHFERHSVFLFPSLSEGYGLALIEAMACGLPSVTTSTGLGGDLVTHGRDALVVPPASSAHLASGIVDLFSNDSKREQLGSCARLNAERYTLDRCAREYESFFKAL